MFVVFGSNTDPRPQPGDGAPGVPGQTFPPGTVSPAKAEDVNAKEPSDTTTATSKTRSRGAPKRGTPRDTGLLIPHASIVDAIRGDAERSPAPPVLPCFELARNISVRTD